MVLHNASGRTHMSVRNSCFDAVYLPSYDMQWFEHLLSGSEM